MKRVMVLTGLLVLAGCGVFEPRDPEKPTDFSARDYSIPQDVIDEIYEIYTFSRPGNLKYLLLDDDSSFTFEGDAGDVVPGAERLWHRDDEIRITAGLLNSDTLIYFFYTTQTLHDDPDSMVFQMDYRMLRRDSVVIKGFSHLSLIRPLNRYYLSRWSDFADTSVSAPDSMSWGRWKMENW